MVKGKGQREKRNKGRRGWQVGGAGKEGGKEGGKERRGGRRGGGGGDGGG